MLCSLRQNEPKVWRDLVVQDKSPEWASVVGGLILLVLVGSIALVAAGGWNWFAKFLESAAPAWVQAVGSIGAVLIAVWVSSRSERHARELEAERGRREMIERLRLVLALLANASAIIKALQNAKLNLPEGATAGDLEFLNDAAQRFSRLELRDMADAKVAVRVLVLPRAFARLREVWAGAQQEARADTAYRDWIAEYGSADVDSLFEDDRPVEPGTERRKLLADQLVEVEQLLGRSAEACVTASRDAGFGEVV